MSATRGVCCVCESVPVREPYRTCPYCRRTARRLKKRICTHAGHEGDRLMKPPQMDARGWCRTCANSVRQQRRAQAAIASTPRAVEHVDRSLERELDRRHLLALRLLAGGMP